MSTPLRWHRLQFPSLLAPEAFECFLRAVHGLSTPGRGEPFVLQLVARRQVIEHFFGVPERLLGAVHSQLATITGLVAEPAADLPMIEAKAAWRLWLSSSRRPLRADDPTAVARAVLSALAAVRSGELVTLQWMLGPVRRAVVVPARHSGQLSESWPRALASAAVVAPTQPDAEARRALRLKQGEPGWRAVGRIGVIAASKGRGHALLGGLLGGLRTAEGPGAALGVRPISPQVVTDVRLPLFWGLALSVSELIGLAGWPLGEDVEGLPVARRRARLLPVPRAVARQGRVLAVEPTTSRPIAISSGDSLHHLWMVGPTGSGKSTLLLNLISQDMAAGRAVCVLEPKGDLIADVLARVPERRRADVVLLDPSDTRPAGLNPLAGGVAPDLVADQLLTVFARLNPDSWGPRLAETLHTALLTLARTQGTSLAALPPLLTNQHFRRRIVSALDDPLGVSPIWAAFERLSEEAKAQTVAAVLNKTRALTSRPALRAVLGQAEPRFALADLFSTRRPILLANFAKGAIGPDSARLLGTLLLNQLWNTTLGRGSLPPDRRHVVCVHIDELQDYVGLPADLGEMLAQARGLGVAFHLANQYAAQLPPALLAGALANARSRVVFQTDSADAGLLTRGHREVTPDDLTNLPGREVYLRLSNGSEVSRYLSGRTLPPPPVTSDPAAVTELSRSRYGVARADTDAALRALIAGGSGSGRPIGSARRLS